MSVWDQSCPSQVTNRTELGTSQSQIGHHPDMTTTLPRILLGLGLLTRVAVSQSGPQPVKLGEIVHNMLFPSSELIGQTKICSE